MSAFGEDDDGHTYLEAVLLHCCSPVGDQDLLDIIKRARAAFGLSRRGKHRAAWRVLESSGLTLLPTLMAELGVGRSHGPRAAFYCPVRDQTFIIGYDWRLTERIDYQPHSQTTKEDV